MIYEFGHFHLDTDKFLLTGNGKKIEVEPQVFDLLVYLIKNKERLVTREQIFENLWSGKEVLDATLSNHIKIARKALNDDGDSQHTIKTVRGRGYQFVADVETVDENGTNQINSISTRLKAKSLKAIMVSLFIIASLISLNHYKVIDFFPNVNTSSSESADNLSIDDQTIDLKSIAVLPFENRSNIASDLFFTDGIHDDLLTRISKIMQLKTISRTSVMAYRHTKKNIKLIAQELGVTSILEGGVQRSGNEIRINVQLINAKTDEHIWAESYTRELTAENVFAIQSEISNEIAKQLKIQLVAKTALAPTQNMAALEAFFLAQFSSDLDNNINYEASIKYLESAINLDPDFSTAYIELANLYLNQTYKVGLNIKDQIKKSRPLLDRAIDLDSDLSRAYRVYGKLDTYDQNYVSAQKNYRKAIEINPNDADAQTAFGWNEIKNGRVESAIIHLKIAKVLNPTDDKLTSSFSRLLIRAGKFEEARTYLKDILKRRVDFADAYRHLSNIQLYSEHQVARSMQTLHKGIMLDPTYILSLKNMAARYVHVGMNEPAIEWYQIVKKLAKHSIHADQAQMLIYFLSHDYDKTYDILLKMSKKDPGYLYHFAKAAIKANRFNEGMKLFETFDPTLFSDKPSINTKTFPRAFVVAKWFNSIGKHKQAKWLLDKCLEIALVETNGQINGRQNNWLTKIYMALGDKEAALKEFKKFVDDGFANVGLDDPDFYGALLEEPEYQRLLKIIEGRIKIEVSLINQMKLNGQLELPTFDDKQL